MISARRSVCPDASIHPVASTASYPLRITLTVLTVAVCSLAVASPLPAAEKKPNILLIMADDVGEEALGCYGGESYDTPRLNSLAESGMKFNHCFSMPVCHPTRICLMTGRYPFRHNHPRWGDFPKQAEKQTFAHMLKDAGYATAVAGKWQITMMKNNLDHPARLGFDEWCLFGWHEGPRYWQPMLYQNGKVRQDVAERYGPTVYCEFLIDFMTKNRNRPFFAYYPMALCHDVTDDLRQPVPYGPGKDRYENFGEMITQMDRHVGMLLDALEKLELREDTLVIFTADNGTPSRVLIRATPEGKYIREPFTTRQNGNITRGGKGQLTNAGTHVALLASWPEQIRAGSTSDALVDFSDFLPTLADVAGASLSEDVPIDGVSFAPELLGKDGPSRDWAFAEHRGEYWVRDARWKLYGDGRLFDVAHDELEKQPIPADKSTPEAQAARNRLRAVQQKLGYKK